MNFEVELFWPNRLNNTNIFDGQYVVLKGHLMISQKMDEWYAFVTKTGSCRHL